MSQHTSRKRHQVFAAEVVRTERLTPRMVRVVLGGPGLAGFVAGGFADHYVKLLFGAVGVDYGEPWDLERIRERHPREEWPAMRTYTVRRWDPESRELCIDFVCHGDEGLTGRWAATVRPGTTVRFTGPGGAYAPDPAADWHLLAGDESALPAIAASLERLGTDARGHAFVEVAGPEEEQKLEVPAGVTLTWLHRGDARVGERLLTAVRSLDVPEGDTQAFVHGEAGFVKDLRRFLHDDQGIPRGRLSASGYWRLGLDEDGWRATKRDFDPGP
jgi:NADPH-dependent ferric siderophore reductase